MRSEKEMPESDEFRYRDPVIEAYKRGIDRTLIRESLKRTPTERIEALIALQRLAEEARRAGAKVFGWQRTSKRY